MSSIRPRIAGMAIVRAHALVILVAAVGCGDDGPPLVSDAVATDAFVAPYWQPMPGEAADWDIQIVAPFDVSANRQMYILDLWDVATGGAIDYGGGEIVTVPMGPLAGNIADITGGGTLVCQVTVGAIRLSDPDAMRFAGFEATPPDRPTDPAAGSAIGWSVIGDPNTRYLDIRQAARDVWKTTMFKRFEYAKNIGCEAIDAIWIDRVPGDYGFPLETSGTDNDISLYYAEVVADLHAKELSAGFHSATPIGVTFTSQFADSYDFAVVERCAEFDECEQVKAFEQANKATFAYDFEDVVGRDRDGDTIDDGISFTGGCLKVADIAFDWIQKDGDDAFRPSSTYRMAKSDCR